MAKKDDSPAISLFSFQDIITSLTGIMFLVVLLLIIFMLEMKPKTDDSASESSAEHVTEQQLHDLEAQIKVFRNQKRKMLARLAELEKMDLEHIQIRVSTLRMETQEQISEAAKKNQLIEKTKKSIQDENIEMKTLTEKIRQLQEQSQRLDQSIKVKEESLKSRHARTMFFKKASEYTAENTSLLKPVLVECSKEGIRILDVSTGEEFDLRQKEGTFESREKAFLNWLNKRNRSKEYYTIMIKPESFEYGKLVERLRMIPSGTSGTSIERGLEILPSDALSVFGEE